MGNLEQFGSNSVILTSRTYREPSEDYQEINTKIDDLMKKLCCRCNSSCITHLFLFFTGRTNIQRFYMGTSMGRLRDPVAGRPGDEMIRRSEDVWGLRDVGHTCFLNSTHKHIKLTLTCYSRLRNGSGKKFSEQYSGDMMRSGRYYPNLTRPPVVKFLF